MFDDGFCSIRVRGADDGAPVEVAVTGELDAAAADGVVAALLAVIAGHPRVVIDFSEVTFLDAGGAGAIKAAGQAASAAGGSLAVHAASARQRWILELCGVEPFSAACADPSLAGEAHG